MLFNLSDFIHYWIPYCQEVFSFDMHCPTRINGVALLLIWLLKCKSSFRDIYIKILTRKSSMSPLCLIWLVSNSESIKNSTTKMDLLYLRDMTILIWIGLPISKGYVFHLNLYTWSISIYLFMYTLSILVFFYFLVANLHA